MSYPNYYAIITADVRYDIKLSANAKLLYGEITALCNANGFCWAKNEYFALLYNKSNETISRWISQLQDRGYIDVKINKTEGNTRKITLLTKTSIPIDKNVNTLLTKTSIPIDKNVKSYIRINNTINNTSEYIEKASDFLKEKYPIRYEQEFLIRFKKQFTNESQFNDFIEDFNNEWDGKDYPLNLFGKFVTHCRNWLRYRKDKTVDISNGLNRPDLRRIG